MMHDADSIVNNDANVDDADFIIVNLIVCKLRTYSCRKLMAEYKKKA